jgi:hypothetical protein
VNHDILGNSRYRKSALKFLMMRAEFIKEVLLDSSVMNSLTDIGELAEAIKFTEQLDYIVKLPFADRIAYKTKYADPQFEGLDLAKLLDKKVAKRTWQSIDAAFDVSLKIGGQTMTGDPVADEQMFARERASADSLRSRVKAYLETYK